MLGQTITTEQIKKLRDINQIKDTLSQLIQQESSLNDQLDLILANETVKLSVTKLLEEAK
jgi:hypothetical protein